MFQNTGWKIQYGRKAPAKARPSPCSTPQRSMEPTTKMTPIREMLVKMEDTE